MIEPHLRNPSALIRGAFIVVAAMLLSAPTPAADIPLETVIVSSAKVNRERVLDGRVEAVKESTVSAQTSGRISAINFDVDDYVPKGSVILRFRDTRQRARVAQAQADVSAAQARYSEALKNFRRISELYADELVSKAELDTARAGRDTSKARLQAAQAELKQAREQLEYTVVRAPYSGIVTARLVEVGEVARPGQPLMSGFSLDQLRVRVDVPQRLINAVRRQRSARLILPDAGGASLALKDITIFPFASEESNTFVVRASLPPGVEDLFPGMLVKVAFQLGQRERLVVPRRAVVQRSEVTGVYVVYPSGVVKLRQIRIGRTAGEGMVEVLGGLSAGERVALDPIRAGVYLKEAAAGRSP